MIIVNKRVFNINQVLSALTGRILVPEGRLDEMDDIQTFLTGGPRPAEPIEALQKDYDRRARILLLEQHPFLARVDSSNLDETNWEAWVQSQAGRLGESFEVKGYPAFF
jgi:hypothetical protein